MFASSKTSSHGFMASALAVLLLAAPAVQAAPITGLSLLIDESGSITATNFNLQKSGYINALTKVLPTDGSVALEVLTFGTSVTKLFGLQTITTATKALLLAALGTNTQSSGNTATGPAIQQAQADLLGLASLNRRIIDVSTDGNGNVGLDENTAATNAVNAGINQVNVLCIGGNASCAFNRGIGSFVTPATFATFESSLTTKLARELAVPEPVSFALLGVGLLGMGLARRRAAA